MDRLRRYGWLAAIALLGCKSSAPPVAQTPAMKPLPAVAYDPVPLQHRPSAMPADDAAVVPVSFGEETQTSENAGTPSPVLPQASENAAKSDQVPPPKLGPPEPLPEGVEHPFVTLDQVTQSVIDSFPGLQIALREYEIARGKEVSAWGEFDLKLKGESIAAPEGFYQTYRNLAKMEQATMPGGSVYGQYRIGDGNFQPWYGERETNEGGEFKVGFLASLLRDRAIDQRRAAIFTAQLQQRQVEPAVRSLVLEFVFAASDAYWSWVAAGKSYDVQLQLLKITRQRNEIYEKRVAEKDLAEIELVQNQRLIAARQTKLIEAERKLQQAAIKLSFFLRDASGNPIVAQPATVPEFPKPLPPNSGAIEEDLAIALANRPETEELQIIRRQTAIDYNLAQNQTLPSLNAGVDASKDVGTPASSKGDKTPFELEAGLFFEMPYQRRKAYGKMQEAQAKFSQIAAKLELTQNKIAIQVRDAHSAMATAYARVQQAHESVVLAEKLVDAERLRFENQDGDLLRVALQESAAIEAALIEIEALADFFKAEAAYRAAIGANPLD